MWPLTIMKMPWVYVKEFWMSCTKRQRRQMKIDAMTKGFLPATSSSGGPDEGPSDREIAALVSRGWGKVQFVDKIGD